MRTAFVFLTAALLCGCAGTHKQGTSVADTLDGVQIDQMTGNAVSGQVFERTILCLNARRETRRLTAITNQSVVLVTNITLAFLTNQTVTITSNAVQTLATNELAALIPAPASDTNGPVTEGITPLPAPPSGSTNVAVTTGGNLTVSRAGNQTVTTTGAQMQRSRQVTTNAGSLSVTIADSLNVSTETNSIVNVMTNLTLVNVTNLSIVLTNTAVHDYFLCVEYTPPPDFTLLPGDSLALLVDGVRHAFAPAGSQSVVVPRKGFSTAVYRVPPQVLVDIANARVVKIRLKGVAQVIDKQMNSSSRANFKKFLVKYFAPESSYVFSETSLGDSTPASPPLKPKS